MPVYRFLLATLILLPTAGLASTEPLVLTGVSGKVIGNSTLIMLDLDRTPAWHEVGVQERGNQLELRLPNTINNAGSLQAVTSPWVLQLLPLQLDANTSALRVFANTEAKRLRTATSVEIAGQQIIAIVDHNKLQQTPSVAKAHRPVAAAAAKAHRPAPTAVVHEGFSEELQIAATVFMALLAVGICFFGLRLLFSARRQQWRNREANTALRIIGQLPLSSQQQLLLVEVYGQKMLLAVSKQRVELLHSNTVTYSNLPAPERQINPPLASPVTDNDLHLNQNSLSAQKSMQRGHHYHRTTRPPQLRAEQQALREQVGESTEQKLGS